MKTTAEISKSSNDERLGTQDTIFFDNSRMDQTDYFVAWIDLMGTSTKMVLSLSTTAIMIGKIHVAAIQANSANKVSLYPLADGLYAIGKEWKDVSNFTANVIRTLAKDFHSQRDMVHKYLVRAAIAYGPIIDGAMMAHGNAVLAAKTEYTKNVLLGTPLAKAHESERKAPPFGIWVDETVTIRCKDVSWTLHRWWSDSDIELAKSMGKLLNEYLEWLLQSASSMRYPTNRHADYVASVKQYYPQSNENIRNE